MSTLGFLKRVFFVLLNRFWARLLAPNGLIKCKYFEIEIVWLSEYSELTKVRRDNSRIKIPEKQSEDPSQERNDAASQKQCANDILNEVITWHDANQHLTKIARAADRC